MPRILFPALCFLLSSGCGGRAQPPAVPPEPTSAAASAPKPAPQPAVDVEAEVAAFLTPTEHPRQHGMRITPSPENPDVKVTIGGRVVDPNYVDPCPVGAMSRDGQSWQDIIERFGAEAAKGFDEIGAFDIPPDRPECAKLRSDMAQRRRDFLAAKAKRPPRR